MEIQKNDYVLLAKGSEIRSYNPSKKVYHLKRQQKVKVWYVLKERKEIKDWDIPLSRTNHLARNRRILV